MEDEIKQRIISHLEADHIWLSEQRQWLNESLETKKLEGKEFLFTAMTREEQIQLLDVFIKSNLKTQKVLKEL